MAKRLKPDRVFVLVGVSTDDEGWQHAKYHSAECNHFRDELYPPSKAVPKERTLYCRECNPPSAFVQDFLSMGI